VPDSPIGPRRSFRWVGQVAGKRWIRGSEAGNSCRRGVAEQSAAAEPAAGGDHAREQARVATSVGAGEVAGRRGMRGVPHSGTDSTASSQSGGPRAGATVGGAMGASK
jgi:hypothetical protein